MTRVLITGVRGKTGVAPAEILAAEAGIEVRGSSSAPSWVSPELITDLLDATPTDVRVTLLSERRADLFPRAGRTSPVATRRSPGSTRATSPRVAARTLRDDALDGRILELSGPEALPLPQTAATLGAHVTYRDRSVEDAVAGTSGFDRQQASEIFVRRQAGEFAEVTDTVPSVTGRPATSLAEFLATG